MILGLRIKKNIFALKEDPKKAKTRNYANDLQIIAIEFRFNRFQCKKALKSTSLRPNRIMKI